MNFSIRSDLFIVPDLLTKCADLFADVGEISSDSKFQTYASDIKGVTNALNIGFFFRDFLESAIDLCASTAKPLSDQIELLSSSVSALSDMAIRMHACGMKILNPYIEHLPIVNACAELTTGLKLASDAILERMDGQDRMLTIAKSVSSLAVATLVIGSSFLAGGALVPEVATGLVVATGLSLSIKVAEFFLKKMEQLGSSSV